ncbi:MAG: 1-deoxy-D-xylulose-5-phosphate synthase [Eubacteriales bacterium]
MDGKKKYEYLGNINSPEELKKLPEEKIPAFASEIREYLTECVTENGGHLASNLGVVELTLAIHRVFDAPHDHIIFDVGHQSYVHKILTGRFSRMDTLRKPGGISGFTKREESEYDAFGAGHSSTSLSAGLGFAVSDKLNGSDAYTVVVLGDGAYTGGMIHEALNNCKKNLNLIIILNENEISISKNTGKFADNIARIRIKSSYFKTKKVTGAFLKHIPLIGNFLFKALRRIKMMIKNSLYGSNYFESMGLTYLGPVDGNDFAATENLLKEAKKLNESVLVHVKTKKGKGYAPAEDEPVLYHGISPKSSCGGHVKSFSDIMGQTLCDMADKDPRICAITAAMSYGTGLAPFQEKHRERFFDVGIAEEHALTFAAGLAADGMRPFFAVYSSFLQRGYDNLIHDIALQKLPVTVCIDRAGLNGSDGATHHGIFDVSFILGIPNMVLYTPITETALKKALAEAISSDSPCAVRYPKGGECARVIDEFYGEEYETLGARANFAPSDKLFAVIITDGEIVTEALKAEDSLLKKGVRIGIILLEKIKPFKECAENIMRLLPKDNVPLIFLEEEIRSGGMGMNISDFMRESGMIPNRKYRLLASSDDFVPRNAGHSVYEDAGISSSFIENAVMEMINKDVL